MPGRYELSTDTGLRLWEGDVEAEDVLWEAAHPGAPLRLAAATPEQLRPPTREVRPAGTGVRMRFYPGVEVGFAEIEVAPSEDAVSG